VLLEEPRTKKRALTRTASVQLVRGPRYYRRGYGMKPEWKYLDTAIAATPVNTAGTMNLLNGIAPGTSASQRVGMRVAIQSLELRLSLTMVADCPSQFNRYLVILDRQPNSAAPAALTAFLTPGTYMGCRNLENRKRFKTLLDKCYVLGGTAANFATEPNKVYEHIYLKYKKPIIEEFNSGVAGTVADIATNSIYFVSVGDVAAGATDSDFSLLCRMRYTDA